ncbi:superoxide dismutase family protein [Haliea sp. E1-2-M8]|uniref:superoxide dismutase family protein n=1 Tax=Haliea sp. E1-2-M8 TaxID=3064706 RepID=UPI00351BF3B2
MLVKVDLEGLEPGPHGFHVHEVGDCSADDGSSAGGHFNPYDTPHGALDAGEHHVGDMGNVEADDDGRVATELTFGVGGRPNEGGLERHDRREAGETVDQADLLHQNDRSQPAPQRRGHDQARCGGLHQHRLAERVQQRDESQIR